KMKNGDTDERSDNQSSDYGRYCYESNQVCHRDGEQVIKEVPKRVRILALIAVYSKLNQMIFFQLCAASQNASTLFLALRGVDQQKTIADDLHQPVSIGGDGEQVGPFQCADLLPGCGVPQQVLSPGHFVVGEQRPTSGQKQHAAALTRVR